MNKLFRGLIAGYGAKKLGGGCISTILIFILIYWALGTCNRSPQPVKQGMKQQLPATKNTPVAVAIYKAA
jgi:hypothetical protein